MDVALIDGDHNWYTVNTELRLLAGVSGRRRAAAGLHLPRRRLALRPPGPLLRPRHHPAEHRHPWRRAGIRRGQSSWSRAAAA